MKYFLTVIFYLFFIEQSFILSQIVEKYVAITIDDLPASTQDSSYENKYYITQNLIEKISAPDIPVIGFVNEGKLYSGGELQTNRVELLKLWLDAGFELGNHTFSHNSLNKVSLDEYTTDIIKGEKILKVLSDKIKYFRHPYLHTGLSNEVRNGCKNFLIDHGYTAAPVTIDNSEWIYARAYENAYSVSNKELTKKIGADYVNYMENVFAYYESQSQKLFGRNIKHILLIHVNRLNADLFGKLSLMIKKRGYKFITLDEALSDDAYKSEDKFYKNNGISWLHRWALTMGKKGDFFVGEPVPEKYINDVAGIEGY